MTRDQQLAGIRAACIQANPEHYKSGNMPYNEVVRLADVLLAAQEHFERVKKSLIFQAMNLEVPRSQNALIEMWKLRQDDLTQQSGECVAFLAELLANN